MKKVAVQIVNYNTKKYLEDCLEDILEDLAHSPTHFIEVVDNASSDDLSDLKRRYEDRNIHFYRLEANVGFGAGHNFLARQYEESEFILILNPDIRLHEPRTIDRLLAYFYNLQKVSRIAALGPKLMNPRGTLHVQHWDHGELRGLSGWLVQHWGASFWKDRNTMGEVAWVSGACFLIKRNIFNTVGGFDENFFLYKEEEDLCRRLRDQGYTIFYIPDICLIHWGSVVALKEKYFPASNRYFLEKYYGRRGTIFYYIFNSLVSTLPFLRFGQRAKK